MRKWIFCLLAVLLLALPVSAEAPVFENLDDVVSYAAECREAGLDKMEFRLSPELFEQFQQDPDAFQTLLGIRKANMRQVSAIQRVTYSGIVFGEPIVILENGEQLLEEVERCLEQGDTTIELYCTPQLFAHMRKTSIVDMGMMPIVDLFGQPGIADADLSVSYQKNMIRMENIRLFPGKNIVLAVRRGDEASLSAREQETLAAAMEVAKSVEGLSDLEKARAIHDWIAERVVYTIDETTDEDDNAIGAILTGEANCDGYSDAFYLIGTLAGLEVRHQHGDSVPYGLPDIVNMATHMWNLIRLDGTWRLVDVTWDDYSDGMIVYRWFNIGYDRAILTHRWNEEMTVPLLPVTE